MFFLVYLGSLIFPRALPDPKSPPSTQGNPEALREKVLCVEEEGNLLLSFSETQSPHHPKDLGHRTSVSFESLGS